MAKLIVVALLILLLWACCRDENPERSFFGALWVSLSMCKPLKYMVYFFNYTLGYSGILRAYTANWPETGPS